MVDISVIFPPDRPPEELSAVAAAADEDGLSALWLWEDCFKESGIATAAAVLAWTRDVRVGIGLLPVPLRNVALTAMELATLTRLFPGRLVAGVGHGVSDWMAQVGARVDSPMTLLAEYTRALHGLLHGEEITTDGRYVRLDAVRLDWPPAEPPPLLVGAVGPRTLELAGELSDGVILTTDTGVDRMREALIHVATGRARGTNPAPPEVVCFVPVDGAAPPDRIADEVRRQADAGATSVALLSVGDSAPPLAEFVRRVAVDVVPMFAPDQP